MAQGPIASCSPSMLNRLLACPARVFFDRQGSGRSAATHGSVMGTAVHAALEHLVVTGRVSDDDVEAQARAAWLEALVANGAGTPPQVYGLPGFYLKRARLARTARRLRDMLSGTDHAAEQELWSKDGTIRGTLDLAVRGPSGTWIVDYKSGIERDETGAGLVEPYERQLLLYAFLWHEQHGEWPSRTIILPLDGPEIDVPVDLTRIAELVASARSSVAEYNAALPHRLSATPSPGACRYCVHVATCDELPRRIDPSWEGSVLGVIGLVTAVETAGHGGRSLAIEVPAGSIHESDISLVRVDPKVHPEVDSAAAQDKIAVLGLYRAGKDGVYGVRETATISIAKPF